MAAPAAAAVATFVKKNWKWLLPLIIVIIIWISAYRKGKAQGQKTNIWDVFLSWGKSDDGPPPPVIDLPNNGTGIPLGWTALPDVYALHAAMDGVGTDYDAIWAALNGKTDDQLAAIYNEFNNQYASEGYGDLFEWFEDDMSGSNLAQALGYFNGVV